MATEGRRLTRPEGAPFVFEFDGDAIDAWPGESVAAALLVAGRLALRDETPGDRRGLVCAIGVCWECRLVIDGEMPEPDDNGNVTVKARAIREVVDPFDQLEDIKHAIDFIEGEPGVDTERIGIWGTSYSGGHAVWTAGHDERIKCAVSQVGAQDSHIAFSMVWGDEGGPENARRLAIQRSRGEIDPVPQGVNEVEGLRGTPHLEKMTDHRPFEVAHKIKVPILLIDAEKEELFDISDHSQKVYEIVKDKVPSKYVLMPGLTHYGVYSQGFEEASDEALAWFRKHLLDAGETK